MVLSGAALLATLPITAKTKAFNMEIYFEPMERSRNEISCAKLVGELKTVMQDAEALMQATAGDLSERARKAQTRLSEALQRAKATCRQIEEKASFTATAADKVVRAHPYESIGIAFGVGLLIGVLLKRP